MRDASLAEPSTVCRCHPQVSKMTNIQRGAVSLRDKHPAKPRQSIEDWQPVGGCKNDGDEDL